MTLHFTVRAVAVLALLSGSGCWRPSVTPPVPRRPAQLELAPTGALVKDPALQALVEQIAAQDTVASEPTSCEGPSPAYAAFKELSRRLGPELPALTRHRSPLVRTYTARHLLARDPEHVQAVAPLLQDQARVVLRNRGSCPAPSDVGTVVLEQACNRIDRPQVQDLLADAVRRQELGSFRAEALQCLSRGAPARARPLALELLNEHQDAYLPAVLRALGAARQGADLATVQANLAHRDPHIREAAASAMGQVPGAQEPLLRALLRDRDTAVRAAAAGSYGEVQGSEPALLRELIKDPEPQVRAEAARSLARFGTPEALGLVESYVLSETGGIEAIDHLGAPSEVALRLVRTVAQQSADETDRVHALRYLAQARDKGSLRDLRYALRSSYLPERVTAADGLAKLQDLTAVPALIEMLRSDPKPSARMAAARALARLSTPEAMAALASAAEEPGPSAAEMRALVLRAQKSGLTTAAVPAAGPPSPGRPPAPAHQPGG